MNHAILVVAAAQARSALRARLEGGGYRVVDAETAEIGLERLRHGVDVAVIVRPDRPVPDLLRRLRVQDPEVPVILALDSGQRVVEALRAGASHCTRTPLDLDEVLVVVEQALQSARLRREVRWLRCRAGTTEGVERIIGESEVMRATKSVLRKIAESPASTVLLTGELGTGKATAARALHAQSDRRDQPFMSCSCAALSERLLEGELFGHERGGFSAGGPQRRGLFELAAGGTVLLEDVAKLAPDLQTKLLRFLQERTFRRVGGSTDMRPHVRIIAATHRDVDDLSDDGAIAPDLLYRLAVLRVHLPPLRERAGDVRLLAGSFMNHFERRFGKRIKGISQSAVQLLEAHPWPGNVLELRNALEHAVLFSEGDLLGRSSFQRLTATEQASAWFELPPQGVDMEALEQDLVRQALVRTGWNQTQAASLLGLTRDQVRYRISKYELGGGDPPPEAEEQDRLRTRAG